MQSGYSDMAKLEDRWRRGKQVQLVDQVKMWPTPTSTLGSHAGLVTPTKGREGGTLVEAVSARTMWPTPSANEDAAGTPNGKMQRMLGNHPDVRGQGPGTLNPTWVEWLMGFPLGWTVLEPSETPSSRRSRRSSGGQSSKPKDVIRD